MFSSYITIISKNYKNLNGVTWGPFVRLRENDSIIRFRCRKQNHILSNHKALQNKSLDLTPRVETKNWNLAQKKMSNISGVNNALG